MTDFILNDELELEEFGDDFQEGETDQTDVDIIMRLSKGELRYAPWLGFGIRNRLRGVLNIPRFVRELKVELENDSFRNPIVLVTQNDLSDLQILV